MNARAVMTDVVIARSAQRDEAISAAPADASDARLLRGACHRAGQRPDPLARNDATLLQSRHDPHVALGAVAERLQRVLVARALVAGAGLLGAREFRDDDAVLQSGLVGVRRGAARQILAAERRGRLRRQFGIGREFLWIGNL